MSSRPIAGTSRTCAPRELDGEIAAGVAFWGYEADGALIGVMGIQPADATST